jgi:hypothetical protein
MPRQNFPFWRGMNKSSLSHKRRASVGQVLVLGILGCVAELPFPAA